MDVERAVLADGDTVQKYLVLLADADAGIPIRGRTRLQKMMFMASRASDELDRESCFGPDNYGPYSEGKCSRAIGASTGGLPRRRKQIGYRLARI